MLLLLRCSLLLFTLCCTSVYSKYISDGPAVRTNVDYAQDKYAMKKYDVHHKLNEIEEPRLERHHEEISSEEIFSSDEKPSPSNKKRQHAKSEKYKCMLKYDLGDKTLRDEQHMESLKEEIVKLQDLVQILKDQQSILKILNSVGTKELIEEKEAKKAHNQEEQSEIRKLKQEVEKIKNMHSKILETISLGQLQRIIPEEEVLEQEVTQQRQEILDLRNMFKSLYKSNRTDEVYKADDSTKPKQNVTNMLEEINLIKTRLSELQDKDKLNDNEVVGAIYKPYMVPKLNKTRTSNKTRGTSARASNTEEMDLLANLIGENKELDSSETSVDAQSLLQILNAQGKGGSLEIDDGNELREKVLLELLKKNKEKNKINNLEEQLKKVQKMVKKLEGLESKSLITDEEEDDKNRIRKLELAIKKLSKKDKIQSKSLDDSDIASELKNLESSIKSLQSSSDDDFNLDSPEEKNLNLQFLLDKLSKPQKIQKPTITPSNMQVLIKKLMKNKGHHQSNHNTEETYHHDHGHNIPSGLNIYSYEEVDDDSVENNGHSGAYQYQNKYSPYMHKHLPQKYGYQNYGPSNYPYNPSSFHQYYPSQTYSNNFDYSNYSPAGNKQYSNSYNYPNTNIPLISPSTYGNYQYGYLPSSSSSYETGYSPSNSYIGANNYGSPIKNDYSSLKYIDTQSKPEKDNFFHDSHKSYSSANTNSASSDYGEAEKTYGQNSQQSYSNTQGSSDDYTQESIKDLKNQIEELQNVINTMNKPEYIQKPGDKETVYSLNEQISDLKGAITNINHEPASETSQNYQITNYETNSSNNNNGNEGNGNKTPVTENTYSAIDKMQDYTPAARNRQGGYRLKPLRRIVRNIFENFDLPDLIGSVSQKKDSDALLFNKHRINKRETGDTNEEEDEAIDVLSSLLNSVVSQSDEDVNPVVSAPNIGDITRRVAELRKQLDHRMTFQPRSDYGNDYNNYYESKDKKSIDKIKFKKKFKKLDIFDKIFDKIIDKIIDKVNIAIPKLLELFFGKFDLNDYMNQDYGSNYGASYGSKYGGDNSIQKSIRGFGLSGFLPMIIFRILSKLHYFVSYLQRYRFFRTFLIPALILLIVAGSIIFLTWWLQSGDEYGKTDSYSGYSSNNNYGNDKNYGDNYNGNGHNSYGTYDQSYKRSSQTYNGYDQNYGSYVKNYRSSNYNDNNRNNYVKPLLFKPQTNYRNPIEFQKYERNYRYNPISLKDFEFIEKNNKNIVNY